MSNGVAHSRLLFDVLTPVLIETIWCRPLVHGESWLYDQSFYLDSTCNLGTDGCAIGVFI
jgi:hypothetical protein